MGLLLFTAGLFLGAYYFIWIPFFLALAHIAVISSGIIRFLTIGYDGDLSRWGLESELSYRCIEITNGVANRRNELACVIWMMVNCLTGIRGLWAIYTVPGQ